MKYDTNKCLPLPAVQHPAAAVRQWCPSARRPKTEPPRWRLDNVAKGPRLVGTWCTAPADCHASHSRRSLRGERQHRCAGQRPPSRNRPEVGQPLSVPRAVARVRPDHHRGTVYKRSELIFRDSDREQHHANVFLNPGASVASWPTPAKH